MKTKYLKVLISAENQIQANYILDELLSQRLIAGGLISKGPAKFWWKGKVVQIEYYNISVFTTKKHKQGIKSWVKKISKEEVPIIAFFEMDGNEEFLRWIDDAVEKKELDKSIIIN